MRKIGGYIEVDGGRSVRTEGRFVTIKGSVLWEEIVLLNVYIHLP